MSPSLARALVPFALCLCALIGSPAAFAKEESKIAIRLVGSGPARGDVRTQLQGEKKRLDLRVRGAEPATEYLLLALDTESATVGEEIGRFTTGPNGQFTGRFALGCVDPANAPLDPRGHYLVVSDGEAVILGGWLYGAVEDDAPMTKVKELTLLAPDPDADPSGSAAARYDTRPNGRGTFHVFLRGVPDGEYEIRVDGSAVGSVTPNPSGNAEATFDTRPAHGSPRSRPHNRKGELAFDPRRKLVELVQGDQVYFSGVMLAQIEGVDECTLSLSSAPLR